MTENPPIRILLVDDHDMVRRGLAVFLEAFDDLQLVAEARGGAEAVEMCARHGPDVVLMDLVMPDMSGVEATQIIRERFPEIQVVALTSFKDEEMIRPVLEAGAISYLFKSVSIDDLADALRAAHAGRSVLAPEATRALLAAARRPHPADYDLTEREIDVLRHIVQGLNNPEIADELGVSRSTIKSHVSNILQKLGTTNRLQAAQLAVREKLLE